MGTTTSQSKLLLNEIYVSVVIVGVEGLEPPCGMPDLQSGAVAAVPYSQKSNSTLISTTMN